jgi:hypothetical protein
MAAIGRAKGDGRGFDGDNSEETDPGIGVSFVSLAAPQYPPEGFGHVMQMSRPLQAVVGGALVMSFAVAADAVSVLGRRRETEGWTGRLARTVTRALGLSMIIAAVGAWPVQSAAAPDLPTDAITERGIVYPEIAALVRALGPHPAVLLRFVTQRITYEPYEGALRGPRGTLLARAGNSVDQALLLRDLLRVADPHAEVQFALGTLPSTDAEALVKGFLAQVGSAARTASIPELQPEPRPRPRGSSPATGQQLRVLVDRSRVRWASLAQKVQADARALGALLQKDGVILHAGGLEAGALVAAARQHVWLQYRTAGRWVDLDPTIPDGTPGTHRTVPAGTSRTLPEGLYHHLAVNVRLEERQDGRLTTRSLLKTVWRTAEIAGSTLTYGHAEPLGFAPTGGATGESVQAVRYTPLLMVDDEYRLGSPLTLPRPARAEGIGGVVGSQVGQFLGGGLPGLGPDRAGGSPGSEPSPQVTGLWLAIVVTRPDGSSDRAERPVFDRIDYAERASGHAATAPVKPLAQSGGHFLALSTVWNIAINVGETVVARSLLRSAPGFSASKLSELYDVIEDLGELHRSFYRLRSALFRSATVKDPAQAVTWRPHVSVLSWGGVGNDGTLSIDLLSSPTELTTSPAPKPPPRLLWAEASVRAERLVLHAPQVLSETGNGLLATSSLQSVDLASILESAEREGTPLVVLRPGGPARECGVGGSPEAQARLRARLNEGLTVVVPQHALNIGGRPYLGWWLIDTRNGFVIDELENGGHAGVEYGATDSQSREKVEEIKEGWVDRFRDWLRKKAGPKVRCALMAGRLFGDLKEAGSGTDPGAGLENLAEDAEGIAAKCELEGEGGFPAPPVAAGGTGPPEPPKLPRIKF